MRFMFEGKCLGHWLTPSATQDGADHVQPRSGGDESMFGESEVTVAAHCDLEGSTRSSVEHCAASFVSDFDHGSVSVSCVTVDRFLPGPSRHVKRAAKEAERHARECLDTLVYQISG